MKKVLLIFFLAFVLTLTVFAADTVYLDGTGVTDGAYTTLYDAAAALKSGGDIILTGDVNITSATTLPEGVALNITAQNGAVLNLGARLTLGGETTFDNITINNASSSYQLIVAAGNPVTFGEGVATTTNGTALVYPVIVGGNYNTACTKGSHITVKGGTWRNIYGANYNGAFTGNSTVDFTGGTVLVTLSGGSYSGNYEGTATLNIGGDAVVKHNTVGGASLGVVGGNVGVNNGNARTFKGKININIGGDAVVNSLIHGSSIMNNITTTADINIDIFGNAQINRNIYGGGWSGKTTTENGILLTVRENVTVTNPNGSAYVCAGAQSGTVTGNVKLVVKDNVTVVGNVYGGGLGGSVDGNSTAEIYGGKVSVNFTAGSRTGNISGDTVVNAYGGKIGYHTATEVYGINGNGGTSGTVSGTAYITLDGADVAGEIAANTEKYDITLKSGTVGSVADTVKINLDGGKLLKANGTVIASELVGGGTLTLAADGSVTTDKMSGETALTIDGTPVHGNTYITVNDTATEGTVAYTPAAETDVLEKAVGDSVTYTLRYTDRFDTTHVKVYYYNPLGEDEAQPKIVMVKGLSTEADRVSVTLTKTTEGTKQVAEADLTAGLYYYKVYYGSGGGDYAIKYFYISGNAESLTFDAPLEPFAENSYMENVTAITTDEVLCLFGTDGLVGYIEPETLATHMNRRSFLTNEEICAYVDELGTRSEYLHVYYPFEKSEMGNEWPIMVFTKDEIIDGATFEEAAAQIRAGGEREILMITAGVHGNEPAGPEGALFLASELVGEYGEEVLDSFGAIVMMPVVSVDNSQRFKRLTESGVNPNRDLVALQLTSSQNQVYVYKSFMPTITIDCHEDSGTLAADASDYSIENMDDVCIRYSSLLNSPLYNIKDVSDGTLVTSELKGNEIMLDAIEAAREKGIRTSIYYAANTRPGNSTNYPVTRGSYGFIVETMRLWSGKPRHPRAVFAMKECLKALIAEFIEADGAIAEEVYANRARIAAITDFDEDYLFAGKTSASGKSYATMPRPIIFADGTYKDESNTKNFNFFDTVSKLRTMPTAYVLDANAANIDKVLALLDMHGIEYTYISPGSTLTLKKYSGIDTAATTSAAVTIGEAEEVTFESGAYAVTLNTSDAFLVAYLFEPDSFPFTSYEDTTISMAHIGIITDEDNLYRSEVSGVVSIIKSLAYVEGDLNGDGEVTLADIMIALKSVTNGEGKYTLLDVLRFLKLAVR